MAMDGKSTVDHRGFQLPWWPKGVQIQGMCHPVRRNGCNWCLNTRGIFLAWLILVAIPEDIARLGSSHTSSSRDPTKSLWQRLKHLPVPIFSGSNPILFLIIHATCGASAANGKATTNRLRLVPNLGNSEDLAFWVCRKEMASQNAEVSKNCMFHLLDCQFSGTPNFWSHFSWAVFF